jgi:hypothetical protein
MPFDMHIGVLFAVSNLSISGSHFMFYEYAILAVGISPLPEIIPQRLGAGTITCAQRARTTLYFETCKGELSRGRDILSFRPRCI